MQNLINKPHSEVNDPNLGEKLKLRQIVRSPFRIPIADSDRNTVTSTACMRTTRNGKTTSWMLKAVTLERMSQCTRAPLVVIPKSRNHALIFLNKNRYSLDPVVELDFHVCLSVGQLF